MLTPWLITAAVAGLAGWFGVARMAARAWPAMGAGLVLLLAGGLACWTIGAAKTGPFPAGLGGLLLGMLLFIATGAVLLGAALRRLHEWWRPPVALPSRTGGWGAVAGIGLFSGIAVLLSVLE